MNTDVVFLNLYVDRKFTAGETCVWYDGPRLIIAFDQDAEQYLCVHDDEETNVRWTMYCVRVQGYEVKDLIDGVTTLQKPFVNAEFHWKWDMVSGTATLHKGPVPYHYAPGDVTLTP